MQRPPRKQCAIKKLMVEEFAWTFLSQKGHTRPPLVSTWEDLLIKERAAVVVEEEAEAEEAEAVAATVIVMTIEVQEEVTAAVEDAVTTTEVTVEAAAVAAAEAVKDTAVVVAAAAVEIAADPPLRTNVLNAVVHVPDLTHPAVIEMIEMGKNLPF